MQVPLLGGGVYDLLHSIRFEAVVEGIEVFAARLTRGSRSDSREDGRRESACRGRFAGRSDGKQIPISGHAFELSMAAIAEVDP